MSKYQVSKGIWEGCAPTEVVRGVREVGQALSPSHGLKIRAASFWMMVGYQCEAPLHPQLAVMFGVTFSQKHTVAGAMKST